MPTTFLYHRCRVRSKAGKELDRAYERHEIGWAHYNKIRNKSKYWDWK